ncbi:MAG: phosphoribosylglycinamide formyltransferase [Phycisphaerales bacterium]|nr:phosphoribosylglycinamide formyltransferase [Phycisphaerales bacterium]
MSSIEPGTVSPSHTASHPALPRLAVLLSGGGRTLDNLLRHIREGGLAAEVGLVIASRACAGADKATGAGIPTHIIKGPIPAAELTTLLEQADIDLVVLAGYLVRLQIPAGYAGRVINIHPALLPAFGGKGMYGHHVHEAVLAAGAPESGCTVHYCDDQYDTGPVIAQARCPVLAGDTPDTLAARVFDLECDLYPRAIATVLAARGRRRHPRNDRS